MTRRERTRNRWDRRAPRYDAPTGRRLERWAVGDSREWICRQATGRTLEVAVGTGRNLPLYAEGVDVTGIDLSPGMLEVARRRAATLERPVALREGDAEDLPYADASFDTVVCTMAVCSIPNREAALAEMYRVLRPGGLLLLVDHAERRWWRGRPADLAVSQGFVPEHRQRIRFGLIERLAARKPAAMAA